MEASESVVHALYKNDQATEAFIDHNLTILASYTTLLKLVPAGTDIFTKTELSRFHQFPKNRPDIYLRTSDGNEAIIILAHDSQSFITRKRLTEIITHSEDDGWDSNYPGIGFVLKDDRAKYSFLHTAHKQLDDLGIDETELTVLATTLEALHSGKKLIWSSAFAAKQFVSLVE
ncbi:MAG: hypothetical protein ABI220_00240 [Candidatus Saccharimonadales bacterium]